jgi:putative tryptophan/tyrosine transport system substrate-binding protein
MKRRAFIAALGSLAAAPFTATAQTTDRLRRIGVLMGYAPNDREALSRAAVIRRTLRERGWQEQVNCELQVKLPGGEASAIRAAAEELVAWKADAVLSSPGQVTLLLTKATATIPVVFANVPDPVGLGLVKSLPRPSGHVTGFTSVETEFAGKWLELLKELSPALKAVAVVYNPDNPAWGPRLALMREVAPALRLRVVNAAISAAADIEPVIGRVAAEPNSGLVVLPSVFTSSHREALAAAAQVHRLPAIYPYRFFAELGGLASYGIDVAQQFRGAAEYVDRILRGEKPGDLPVQAPTSFEFVINQRTARSLGLTVPPTLLARADEVIE